MKSAHSFAVAASVLFIAVGVDFGNAADQLILGQKKDGDNAMTIDSGFPITNPPTEVSVSPPTADSYNRLLNTLFGEDLVDVGRTDGLLKLADRVQHETSNGFFKRLKIREKDFHGGILVEPEYWKERHEQIVIVRARVEYIDRGKRGIFGNYEQEPKKVLRCENIMIYFNGMGVYEKVFMGVPTREGIVGK